MFRRLKSRYGVAVSNKTFSTSEPGAYRRIREEATAVEKGANSENSRIAAMGMYLAAAELCKHGFNVTPTSRNMAGADLLITDDRCRNTWTIQVKVTDQRLKRRRGWLLGRKASVTAQPTHAYIFVIINSDGRPDFYVVPSDFVSSHQVGATSMPEFRRTEAAAFQDNWTMLKRNSSVTRTRQE